VGRVNQPRNQVLAIADGVGIPEGSIVPTERARSMRIAGVNERGTSAQGFPWNLGDLNASKKFGSGTATAGFQACTVSQPTA
jgi:hypothetical protein